MARKVSRYEAFWIMSRYNGYKERLIQQIELMRLRANNLRVFFSVTQTDHLYVFHIKSGRRPRYWSGRCSVVEAESCVVFPRVHLCRHVESRILVYWT